MRRCLETGFQFDEELLTASEDACRTAVGDSATLRPKWRRCKTGLPQRTSYYLMVNFNVFEVPPPGFGFVTPTCAVPGFLTSDARIFALSLPWPS